MQMPGRGGREGKESIYKVCRKFDCTVIDLNCITVHWFVWAM